MNILFETAAIPSRVPKEGICARDPARQLATNLNEKLFEKAFIPGRVPDRKNLGQEPHKAARS